MRFVAQTPVRNACVQTFIESYQRLRFPVEFDGQRIVAGWDEETGEGEKKRRVAYDAEVDLLGGEIAIYALDKRRKKVCRSRLSAFDLQLFQAIIMRGKRKVYLTTTKCLGPVCLVPVHYGGYPALAVANRDEKLVELKPSYAVEDRVYFADARADLAPPPPEEDFDEKAVRLAAEGLAKYGAEAGALAILPYVQVHAIKRYVPVVVGPMRSGKTIALNYILSAWPQPKKYISMPTAPSLRDALVRYHVAADDVGEDPERPFSWRLVIPYFERGTITRINPSNMREKSYIMRGALVIGTNAPSDDVRSVQDRLRYFHLRIPPGTEAEPSPALSWLTYNPYLYLAPPPWLSAIDAAVAMLFGVEPPPPPKHDPMNEPYNAFIYQLYRRLAKIRAEHDPCNSPYAKLIDGRQYVALKLAFENPLYSDRRVVVSESLTIRDVKSVTRTRSQSTMRYSVTEAKQILEHFAVPAEVRLLGKNYYILIECERAEEVFTALRSIVASNISDTAI